MTGGRLGLHPGSAKQARDALLRRSLLIEGDSGPALVDPLLGVWVRATQAPP